MNKKLIGILSTTVAILGGVLIGGQKASATTTNQSSPKTEEKASTNQRIAHAKEMQKIARYSRPSQTNAVKRATTPKKASDSATATQKKDPATTKTAQEQRNEGARLTKLMAQNFKRPNTARKASEAKEAKPTEQQKKAPPVQKEYSEEEIQKQIAEQKAEKQHRAEIEQKFQAAQDQRRKEEQEQKLKKLQEEQEAKQKRREALKLENEQDLNKLQQLQQGEDYTKIIEELQKANEEARLSKEAVKKYKEVITKLATLTKRLSVRNHSTITEFLKEFNKLIMQSNMRHNSSYKHKDDGSKEVISVYQRRVKDNDLLIYNWKKLTQNYDQELARKPVVKKVLQEIRGAIDPMIEELESVQQSDQDKLQRNQELATQKEQERETRNRNSIQGMKTAFAPLIEYLNGDTDEEEDVFYPKLEAMTNQALEQLSQVKVGETVYVGPRKKAAFRAWDTYQTKDKLKIFLKKLNQAAALSSSWLTNQLGQDNQSLSDHQNYLKKMKVAQSALQGVVNFLNNLSDPTAKEILGADLIKNIVGNDEIPSYAEIMQDDVDEEQEITDKILVQQRRQAYADQQGIDPTVKEDLEQNILNAENNLQQLQKELTQAQEVVDQLQSEIDHGELSQQTEFKLKRAKLHLEAMQKKVAKETQALSQIKAQTILDTRVYEQIGKINFEHTYREGWTKNTSLANAILTGNYKLVYFLVNTIGKSNCEVNGHAISPVNLAIQTDNPKMVQILTELTITKSKDLTGTVKNAMRAFMGYVQRSQNRLNSFFIDGDEDSDLENNEEKVRTLYQMVTNYDQFYQAFGARFPDLLTSAQTSDPEQIVESIKNSSGLGGEIYQKSGVLPADIEASSLTAIKKAMDQYYE